MIKAVLLFLLLLLKILGWAVLLVLLLLVIVLLLLLFVPLRYDVSAKNERGMSPNQKGLTANVQLRLKVNWLLHFLQVSVLYGPDGLSNQILVAGIDIPKLLTRHAEKKKARRNGNKRKKGRQAAKKAEEPYAENNNSDNITLTDGSSKEESLNKELLKEELLHKEIQNEEIHKQVIQNEEIQNKEIQNEEIQKQVIQNEEIQNKEIQNEEIENEEIQKRVIQNKQIQNKEIQNKEIQNKEIQKEQRSKKSQSQKALHKDSGREQKTDVHSKAERGQHTKTSAADTRQPGILKKIRLQLQRLHKEYTDEANRHAVGRLWIELLKLLRSYKPRKLKADVSFSLADPSLTGIATGMLSLMPVIYRYPCMIVPDFTSERLYAEGEISASGKVRIFVFLCSMLRLIRDKKFMQVVRRLMKRGSA